MFRIGNQATPATSSAVMPPPARQNSTDYATHVLCEGNRQPLNDQQCSELIEELVSATWRSHEQLADLHTVNTIRELLCRALEQSSAMRAAVSYGMMRQLDPIGAIGYRNTYSVNPDAPDPLPSERAIRHLTAEQLRNADAMPIIPVNEAGYDADDRPYVSTGVAPDADSPHMPLWQLGLLQSVLTHVTDASFPSSGDDASPGALETMARQVLSELGIAVPTFTGHACAERFSALADRDTGALREAAERHADDTRFFEQLARVSVQAELGEDSDTDDSDDDDPAAVACADDSTAQVEQVLRAGTERPLAPDHFADIREETAEAVERSAGNLVDEHTGQSIGRTLLDALLDSRTMQAAVSYAAAHNHPALQHIDYLNRYRVNPTSPTGLDYEGQIADLTLSQLLTGTPDTTPILPLRMAGEHADGDPWVSIGAAPNFGSLEMSLWQYELLRLVLSHLTGSIGQGADEDGPDAAAVLAHRVCTEMEWTVPSPHAESHTTALLTNDVIALCESVERHRHELAVFLARLTRISQGESASTDDEDLSRPSSREE